MSTKDSEEAFLKSLSENWVAGYPPWYWQYLIREARCKTKEEGERLLYLLRSIEDKKPEDTRRLLAEGVDPNLYLSKDDGRLIEFATMKYTHPDCIRALLEAGAKPKGTYALFKVVEYQMNEVLDDILKAGANIEEVRYGTTPLTVAIMNNNADAVRRLIAAGADVNATAEITIKWNNDVKGCTPLMFAVFHGHLSLIKILIASKADIHRVDASGGNVMAWARRVGNKAKSAKIITLLEQLGVSGDTPESQAVPLGPDFSSRAKSANFKKAIALAREITGTEPQRVTLEEGVLAGARAFPIGKDSHQLLDRLRTAVRELNTMSFISTDVTAKNGTCIVILPTTDYAEAIIAFETPVGQSLSSDDLVRWLKKLHQQQPFEIVELAPDLVRAQFTTEITDPPALAKGIQSICNDVINESMDKVADSLARSRELYLWWD